MLRSAAVPIEKGLEYMVEPPRRNGVSPSRRAHHASSLRRQHASRDAVSARRGRALRAPCAGREPRRNGPRACGHSARVALSQGRTFRDPRLVADAEIGRMGASLLDQSLSVGRGGADGSLRRREKSRDRQSRPSLRGAGERRGSGAGDGSQFRRGARRALCDAWLFRDRVALAGRSRARAAFQPGNDVGESLRHRRGGRRGGRDRAGASDRRL